MPLTPIDSDAGDDYTQVLKALISGRSGALRAITFISSQSKLIL
jgi:hypothetical protein